MQPAEYSCNVNVYWISKVMLVVCLVYVHVFKVNVICTYLFKCILIYILFYFLFQPQQVVIVVCSSFICPSMFVFLCCKILYIIIVHGARDLVLFPLKMVGLKLVKLPKCSGLCINFNAVSFSNCNPSTF